MTPTPNVIQAAVCQRNADSSERISHGAAGTLPQCIICGDQTSLPLYELNAFDGPYEQIEGSSKRTVFRCGHCGYAFIYPFPNELYSSYYQSLENRYHINHDQDTSRYREILSRLDIGRVRRILDWGCGSGSFLSLLTDSIKKYGVESSRGAAEIARQRGIELYSPSQESLRELNGSVDVVTAIDVIEHVTDLATLKKWFSELLCPGGTLILLTGDLESSTAKAAGRYWYYMHYSEHVSFLSSRNVRHWLEPEFEDITVVPITHHKGSFGLNLYLSLLFPISWLLEKAGLNGSLRISAKRFVKNDHMLVTARKRQS
jgi:SAM-dependent methyltransferase